MSFSNDFAAMSRWADSDKDPDARMMRQIRQNRAQMWESMEDWITSALMAPDIHAWMMQNGVTPDELERVKAISDKLRYLAARA